jgi:hypothetical protein
MAKRGQRDPGKEKFWRRMLRLWRRSGLSGREFCAVQGLGEASFYAWRREIARRDEEHAAEQGVPARPATAFVQLRVDGVDADAAAASDVAQAASQAIEVVTTQGHVLRVPPGFEADALRRLLSVLEGPPC